MKVVLFCGGFGMRLREYSESTPKPLVRIGTRPILWHVMKYYAHYGHKDFILCLGWKGNEIKQYFLRYDECISNDFVLGAGGSVHLLNSDIHDWNITFVETGTTANIAQRLLAVREHLRGEEAFLANYTDGLTDLHLPDLIDLFHARKATAAFLSVRPSQSFHAVTADEAGVVSAIDPIAGSGVWMNGGFFVFGQGIFSQIRRGEELVDAPLRRLAARRKVCTLRYEGFWSCMDTYKEKQGLDEMYERDERPWEVWRRPPEPRVRLAPP